jgi:hypothetical protein
MLLFFKQLSKIIIRVGYSRLEDVIVCYSSKYLIEI